MVFITKGPCCAIGSRSGAPLREPIAQHGPFVMNTIAELRRAFDDYAAGRLGAIPAREVAAEEVAP